MPQTLLSGIAGVTPNDTTAGSTAASVINNFIAAMAVGDVLIWDCAVSPNGQINVTNKLGIRISGAGPMGSRLSPQGNNNGFVVAGCESIVIENIGVAPKSVQSAGVGFTFDVGLFSGRGAVSNIFRNIDVFDRSAQASLWGLGTGRPFKGFHIKGEIGGYNSFFYGCKANGCVSTGWEFGTYNQTGRGSVGVGLVDCQSARNATGYTVFAAEALTLLNSEALSNTGDGFNTYPDNGGIIGVRITQCYFDSNSGYGVNLLVGNSGTPGVLKFFEMTKSRPAANQAAGIAIQGISGHSPGASGVKEVILEDNYFAVNAWQGADLRADDRLYVNRNKFLANGTGASNVYDGLVLGYVPADNQLDENLSINLWDGVPGDQKTGVAISAAVGVVQASNNGATDNLSGQYYTAPGVTISGVNNW